MFENMNDKKRPNPMITVLVDRCEWCGSETGQLFIANSGELFHRPCHQKMCAASPDRSHTTLGNEWRP